MGRVEHRRYVPAKGQRSFLQAVQQATGLSLAECELIIEMGGAYRGKRRFKNKGQLLKAGELIQVFYRLPIQKEEMAFQDDWIVCIEPLFLVARKPAGLPTQGKRECDTSAFYELLKKRVPGYLGLHHRLDQGTSGLMVFSRSRKSNPAFHELFTKRLISKQYLALCTGTWPDSRGERTRVDQPLARVQNRGKHGLYQVDPGGKPAQTELELIGQSGGLVLMGAKPLTGRTHQIRVHAAHLGLPLLGDTLYGGADHGGGFYLHACQLSWPSCQNLNAGSFYAPIPKNWYSQFTDELLHAYKRWEERCLVD
ncbi:MAG: hypothetical protein CSA81_01525 [Acidobacteria bacterium]|nr:MAG: hypothetical protein CSA81_01525 [Acidobacteriota bacterium]